MGEIVNGREIVVPHRLQPAGSIRNVWGHAIPEGTPYTAAFEVEYWRKTVGQLRGGDRIEVQTWDKRIIFEIFVLEANPQSDPPRLDLCWRAVYPPDLKVPKPVVEPARWLAKQQGTDGSWYVYDVEKGEIIADQLRKEAAQQQVSLLEKLARETSKVAA